MKFWISLIGYQIVWFSAVMGAGHGHVWPALTATLLYATWQLGVSRNRKADILLILWALAIGCLFDGVLLNAGLLQYAVAWPLPILPPVWILALWICFALTFTQSLKYLQTRMWVAALLGAIGGPLAYLGAAHGWHVVSFAQPAWQPLLCLAAGWSVATPLLACLAKRLSPAENADFIHLRRPVS